MEPNSARCRSSRLLVELVADELLGADPHRRGVDGPQLRDRRVDRPVPHVVREVRLQRHLHDRRTTVGADEHRARLRWRGRGVHDPEYSVDVADPLRGTGDALLQRRSSGLRPSTIAASCMPVRSSLRVVSASMSRSAATTDSLSAPPSRSELVRPNTPVPKTPATIATSSQATTTSRRRR
jgi:hypothetical protein